MFYDIMTTGLNPFDGAPGYMLTLEYCRYGSTGTCSPSGRTVIAIKLIL